MAISQNVRGAKKQLIKGKTTNRFIKIDTNATINKTKPIIFFRSNLYQIQVFFFEWSYIISLKGV